MLDLSSCLCSVATNFASILILIKLLTVINADQTHDIQLQLHLYLYVSSGSR